VPIHLSDKAGRGMGFVVSNGVQGTLTWREWLGRRSSEVRAAA
jgi:hypothetical protein